MARKRETAEAPPARFRLRRTLLLVGWFLLILYIVAIGVILRQEMANGAPLSSRSFLDALTWGMPSPLSWALPAAVSLLAIFLFIARVAGTVAPGGRPTIAAGIAIADVSEPTSVGLPADLSKTTDVVERAAPEPMAQADPPVAEQSAPGVDESFGAAESSETRPKRYIPRIFISHSGADDDNAFGLALADELADALDGPPDTIWYDRTGSPENDFASGLGGGDPWWERIQKEISNREICIIILSQKAMDSKWVRQEVNLAQVTGKIIVPVLYQDCVIPDEVKALRLIQRVSFLSTRPHNEALAELLAAIRVGYTRMNEPDKRILRPTGMPFVAKLVGRDEEIALIQQTLRTGDSVGICALKGMGGIGKSALAAWITDNAAEDTEAFPGGAAWIPCDRLTATDPLQGVYEQLARILGRDDIANERDITTRERKLIGALEDRQRTLLTFDNIDPEFPVDALVSHIAIRGRTALLLTSREPLSADLDQQITIDPLSERDGSAMFSDRLKRKGSQSHAPENVMADVNALVTELGGLPLAIYLTAAYCAEYHQTPGDMLKRIKEERLHAGPFVDPKDGLQACFDRSWRRLPTHCQYLFAGLSLFGGASFPSAAARSLASALEEIEPFPRSSEQPEDADLMSADIHRTVLSADYVSIRRTVQGKLAVDMLVKGAMVEAVSGERLRLHPLLREYAADRLEHLRVTTHDSDRLDIRMFLGLAMAFYWAEFAEQNETEFGDLALAAESDGIAQAINWAQQHGIEDILDRIRTSQARAGTRRTFHFLSAFSVATRRDQVDTETRSLADLVAFIQTERRYAPNDAPTPSHTTPVPRSIESFAQIETTYARLLSHPEASSDRLNQEDKANIYYSRASNQVAWARTELLAGRIDDAETHLRQARIYGATALGLGYQDALRLVRDIEIELRRLDEQR